MSDFIGRGIRFVRKRGMRGVLEKLHLAPKQQQFLRENQFLIEKQQVPFNREEYLQHKNDETKILNWIIPEMGVGSGGHINIFRFASLLEDRGFHSRIYLFCPSKYYENQKGLEQDIKEHFKILDSRVEVYWNIKEAGFAHGTIATSWQTAYFVKNFQNAISKFYFVQDYEPYFFPLGSHYKFAEDTYSFGFRGITAGEWLEQKLEKTFGMECDSFHFSYDKELYQPKDNREGHPQVFFYARPITERRCLEIGLMALHELCARMPEVEVLFAGWDMDYLDIPFRYRNLKIVELEKLADVYSCCDLCLVLSGTNLSLLPLEIMGSGSTVVCTKGENSTWLVNEENCVLVDFDPLHIADQMEYYLKHPEELEEIRKKGMAFANSSSWEKEADKVEKALKKGILQDGENLQ